MLLHAPLSSGGIGCSLLKLGRVHGGASTLVALASAPCLPRALHLFSVPRRMGDIIDTATSLGLRPHALPAIAAWLLQRHCLISLHTHVVEVSPPPAADPADATAMVRIYIYIYIWHRLHPHSPPPTNLLAHQPTNPLSPSTY